MKQEIGNSSITRSIDKKGLYISQISKPQSQPSSEISLEELLSPF